MASLRHSTRVLTLASVLAPLVAIVAIPTLTREAGAAPRTWLSTATSGNMSTGANWQGGTAPVSTDNLLFGNGGAAAVTVTVDAATWGTGLASASSLSGIAFTGGTTAFTLDLSSFNFNVSNPNAITMASGVTADQTIGSTVGSGTVFVGSGGSGGTVFLTNASASNNLVINSNMANGGGGNNSIVFGNTNGATTTTSGTIIVNGAIAGMANGVTKTGAGVLTLAGANTYTGVTSINSGTLSLTGGISAGTITVYEARTTPVGSGAAGGPATGGVLSQTTTGSITGAAVLTLNSSLAAGGTPSSATLLGNNTYTGATTVGTAQLNVTASPYVIGRSAVVAPTLTFSGTNNGQGTITVNPGAALRLDFTPASAPTSNILNNSTNTTSVSLVSGTLAMVGRAGTTNSQQLNGVTFVTSNASAVRLTSGSAGTLNVTLGAFTRNNGATVDWTLPASGSVVTTSTAASVGTNRILASATNGAAYATVSGTTWATNASGTIGALGAGAYSTNAFTTGADVDVTSNVSAATPYTINTLRLSADGVTVTQVGSGTITSGGVLVTPAAVTGVTITGGTLRSGATNEMVFHNNGRLTVQSAIVNASGAVTVTSAAGTPGVATFSGNNTLAALNMTSGSATFSGNNTISGAVTVGPGASLTLSGSNTTSSVFGWAGAGGGTLVLAAPGAIGTGTLQNSANGTLNMVRFASDLPVSGGGAPTATVNYNNGNGAGNNTWVLDRATPGAAVNQAFNTGAAGIGQQQTLNLLAGPNVTSGVAIVTFNGTTAFGIGNNTVSQQLNGNGAAFSLGVVQPVVQTGTAVRTQTLILNGAAAGNQVTGGIADTSVVSGTVNQAAITKSGVGTWTFSGSNSYTGATTLNGGSLVLDYATSNTNKIAASGTSSATLTLNAGTLELRGGNFAQTVQATTLGSTAGQAAISQTGGGSSTIALGAMTLTGGALNLSAGGIATTSSTNVNGILGGSARVTVGGADWAATGASGTNPIVAFAGYTALPTGTTLSGTNANTGNFSLAGSLSVSGAANMIFGTLKIAPTASGTLAFGTNNVRLGNAAGNAGLLLTGSQAYTISSTSNNIGAATGNMIVQQWSSAPLTLDAALFSSFDKYGTGKFVLQRASSGATTANVYAGSLEFSADSQIGNTTAAMTVSGAFGAGAAVVANTGTGSFTVNRGITLGAQGGSVIDVVGGNAVTLAGVIAGTQSNVANNIVTYGNARAVDAVNNAVTSGTIVLAAANTYSGGSTLAAGVVQLGAAENPGAAGPLGNGGAITFTGGTLQYSASNAFDYSPRFSQVAGQSFAIDTNGQNVTFASVLAGANGTLTKLGSGRLTLAAANTYTGGNTVQSGTLLVGNAGALGATTGPLAVNGGSLDLGGFGPTVGAFSGSAAGVVTSAAPGVLTVSVSGSSTFAGRFTGAAGLTQNGPGLLNLTGSSSSSGAFTVSTGSLAVNGVLGTGPVTVASGAWLQGSGTIGGAVDVIGTLSPGNSPGVITLGSVVLGGSSTTLIEINGLVRGTDYDGVNITGTSSSLTYGGLLSLNFGSLSPDGVTYDVFNFSGGSIGGYATVTSTGAYIGTWMNIGGGQYQLISGAQTLTFDQASGDIVVVPEPAAMALAGLGIALAGRWLGRRRRRPSATR
jgi:fibronectin-binding autotransporter adhesin